ncbi:MAG: DUF1810 domain-containing protein [Ruminococcaceae bacterium]|nr:DUF1810 domain-containing protein [Oscillospiraceae bacterium]
MQNAALNRFLEAQNGFRYGSSYEDALAEIRRGRKITHWIWYVFPQLRGLGRSEYSYFFGLENKAEAEAYLAHEILGARLKEITAALLDLPETNILKIVSGVDAVKLRSCMTLFAQMENAPEIFERVLEKYFGGKKDEKTLSILNER